ncbi:PH-domain-containing protein [Hesseltinella vesiculosa]|uniref:PH-domain-containing protein n=1 Tax=Hesseltinella vesiculosa TaxID=101127 RepID=A0A1X2GIB3_9FUNG|nr:PH-domain-containing protein [Hesseltinella vesiculosa]
METSVAPPDDASLVSSIPIVSNDYMEDGPLFRATIRQLEGQTQRLKNDLKRLVKCITTSLEAKQAWLAADEALMASLQETPAAKSLCTSYLDLVWASLHEQRERLQHSMETLLADPLLKLYEMDLKVAEAKHKEFEMESKEYYTYLGKYLGMKKTSQSSSSDAQLAETKHIFKKRRFDLICFDYRNYLLDLHGGKKEQEILFHLFTYHQKEHTFYQSVAELLQKHSPALDDMGKKMAEVSRNQLQINKDRQERRHMLQEKYSNDLTIERPDESDDKFQGVRDLAERNKTDTITTDRRKEGFLFSTTKSFKPNSIDVSPAIAWHKYWCVLSGGQLHEYSNWKNVMTRHLDPIHLRFATVRLARNVDRRFAFEIITPQIRRVYQATSVEDMQTWIQTIQNAIEGVLDGTGTTLDLPQDMADHADDQSIHVESLLGNSFGPLTPPIPSPSKSKTKRRSFHRRSLSGVLRRHYASATNVSSTSTAGSTKIQIDHDLALDRLPSTSSSGSSSITASPASPPPPMPANLPPIAPPDQIRWSVLSGHTIHHEAGALLDAIRLNDPLNYFCADCGEKNPEWCSLNLGLILCIGRMKQ